MFITLRQSPVGIEGDEIQMFSLYVAMVTQEGGLWQGASVAGERSESGGQGWKLRFSRGEGRTAVRPYTRGNYLIGNGVVSRWRGLLKFAVLNFV